MELLLPLALFALMWAVVIRPQQQRVRRQRDLISALELGDEVVTAGGIVGRVVGLEGDELLLEVAPGVSLRVLRLAVSSRVGPEPDSVDDTGREGLDEGEG